MAKVCHMTSAHRAKDERIFFKEAVSLARNQHEVYIVAEGNDREECGVHFLGAGSPPESRLNRMLCFSKSVYQKALQVNGCFYRIILSGSRMYISFTRFP